MFIQCGVQLLHLPEKDLKCLEALNSSYLHTSVSQPLELIKLQNPKPSSCKSLSQRHRSEKPSQQQPGKGGQGVKLKAVDLAGLGLRCSWVPLMGIYKGHIGVHEGIWGLGFRVQVPNRVDFFWTALSNACGENGKLERVVRSALPSAERGKLRSKRSIV